MTHSTSRRLIGIMFRPACQILILIGLATLLLSVVTIWQYQASTRRTKETNARVISVNKITGIGDDERGRNNQACQVDYRFRIKGDEYTAILGYRGEPTTDKCRLHSGQSVKIKYDPNHPANNAYLPDHQNSGKKTLRQTIFASGSIAATGIVPIIIGMVGLRIAKHNTMPSRPTKQGRNLLSRRSAGLRKALRLHQNPAVNQIRRAPSWSASADS